MKFVITRLYLEHFGQFHKKEIIPGEGLNVIYGWHYTTKKIHYQ